MSVENCDPDMLKDIPLPPDPQPMTCPEMMILVMVKVEAELKKELMQLVEINTWLTRLFMTLLESVEKPDGTKFLSSSPDVSGGQRKKAVLEAINYLLVNAGLPACPGALGELIYNDLCVPFVYNFSS